MNPNGDTLDIDRCAQEIERTRHTLGVAYADALPNLLLDSNVSPTLAEYFRDLESRVDLARIAERASAVQSMRDELVTVAERDHARRIRYVQNQVFA